MRLVTHSAAGSTRPGVRRDGAIADTGFIDLRDLIAAGAAGLAQTADAAAGGAALEGVTLLAPIRSGKMLCSGVNYAGHGAATPDHPLPEEPFLSSTLPSAAIGTDEPIRIPRPTTLTGYEVELALIIGPGGYRIPETSALDHVFGRTILNDVSARDVQFKGLQITLEPGDLVSTGTPAGVGCFRGPAVYLQPGDVATVSVDRIGDLPNPVVAGW